MRSQTGSINSPNKPQLLTESPESRAIARYIAEKYHAQGTPLLGTSLQERAQINQWIESEAHNLYPPLRPLVKEIYVAKALDRAVDNDLIATCTAELEQVLDVYEAHFAKSGREYLAGGAFTMADLCHTPYLYQVKLVKGEVLEGRPLVAAYVERITTREGFQKCLQLDWDSAQPLL